VHDGRKVKHHNLAGQFFLNEEDLGRDIGEVTLK